MPANERHAPSERHRQRDCNQHPHLHGLSRRAAEHQTLQYQIELNLQRSQPAIIQRHKGWRGAKGQGAGGARQRVRWAARLPREQLVLDAELVPVEPEPVERLDDRAATIRPHRTL